MTQPQQPAPALAPAPTLQQVPVLQQQQVIDPDLVYPGQTMIQNGLTVFLYGGIGTIKTTFAGTAPSPVFLSAGIEGGDDSLAALVSIWGINPPPVYQIVSPLMMRQKAQFIIRNYERYGWKTVVIDSVTSYMDMWIREKVMAYQKDGKDPQMQMRDWGFLEVHMMKELAQSLHATKLNVIWICLTKEKYSAPDRSGERHLEGVEPLIQGATKIKLPSLCKMVIFADKKLMPIAGGGVQSTPVFHTAPTLHAKDPRHKYGNTFPEGKLVTQQYGEWPVWQALEERIGHYIYK